MSENENENKTVERYTAGILGEIVRGFTDHHHDLEINVASLGHILMISLRAHASETPRIIGSQGRHVSALQTIMDRVGGVIGRRVRLEVKEAIRGEKQRLRPYEVDPNWSPDRLQRILEKLTIATTGDRTPVVEVQRAGDAAMFRIVGRGGEKIAADHDVALAIDRIMLAIGRHQGQQVFLESAALLERSTV